MRSEVVLEEYAKTRSRRVGNTKRYLAIGLLLAPFLIAFIMFFLYPLGYGIYISFTNFKYGTPGQTIKFNDAQYYKMIFDVSVSGGRYFDAFWRSFLHSFVFSVIMVPLAILVPLFLAILINTKIPGFKVFRTLIYLPAIVPLTATACIFVLCFNDAQNGGLLNNLFGAEIKWFSADWFSFKIGDYAINVAYAWIPIFLMCFWGGWGGNFIILSAGLQNVSRNLYEAAEIDGAGRWKRITNITIPGIKPQLVLCLFTTIIGYLGLYGQNFTLTSGGPFGKAAIPAAGRTSTVMYFIQDCIANNNTLKSNLYGLGAAASLIFALLVGIISGIQMFCTRDKKTGFKVSEAYFRWDRIE